MFIAYFMALMLSCETIVYKFFSTNIVFLYVLPLAPIVNTRSGFTFHPLAVMSSIRPWYFSVFSWILSGE
jgi:hypothetical protein